MFRSLAQNPSLLLSKVQTGKIWRMVIVIVTEKGSKDETTQREGWIKGPKKKKRGKQARDKGYLPICTWSVWLKETNADVSSIHDTTMFPANINAVRLTVCNPAQHRGKKSASNQQLKLKTTKTTTNGLYKLHPSKALHFIFIKSIEY